MFVDITDFKSALAVENMLTPYKKGRLSSDKKTRLPKEKITPEVCMEVLRSTNYARNIKDMLLCIAELLASEQAQFKDVVLATFSNREQSNDIIVLGKKLAVANGYEQKLSEAQKLNDGKFLLSASRLSYGVKRQEMSVFGENFDGIDKLICTSDKDISMLLSDIALPPMLEFPNSPHVMLMCSNWADIKQIKLKEGAEICFSRTDVLPVGLDLSMCSKVTVDVVDEHELKKLNHLNGKLAFFKNAENYDDSTLLDLTPFDEITLSFCSYKGKPNMRFKDGAKLNVMFTNDWLGDLPDWDYTQFSELQIKSCELKQGAELKFRDGANVILDGVRHLPSKIDFSNCASISFEKCDFSKAELLIFKNREQFVKSHVYQCLKKDWMGELIFADENNRHPVKFNDDLLDAIYQIKRTR